MNIDIYSQHVHPSIQTDIVYIYGWNRTYSTSKVVMQPFIHSRSLNAHYLISGMAEIKRTCYVHLRAQHRIKFKLSSVVEIT